MAMIRERKGSYRGDNLKGYTLFLLIIFLFTGCTATNSVPIAQNEQEMVSSSIDKDFSYLNELPQEQLENYKLFANDRDVSHLTDFSPEQIVMIYLHSAVMGDVDAIYALTYDDGTLPNFDEFKIQYFNYLHHHDLETALMHRYYNFIAVKKETIKQNELAVELQASIGIFTSSVVFGLKKDKQIWKMDIYHLIKYDMKDHN